MRMQQYVQLLEQENLRARYWISMVRNEIRRFFNDRTRDSDTTRRILDTKSVQLGIQGCILSNLIDSRVRDLSIHRPTAVSALHEYRLFDPGVGRIELPLSLRLDSLSSIASGVEQCGYGDIGTEIRQYVQYVGYRIVDREGIVRSLERAIESYNSAIETTQTLSLPVYMDSTLESIRALLLRSETLYRYLQTDCPIQAQCASVIVMYYSLMGYCYSQYVQEHGLDYPILDAVDYRLVPVHQVIQSTNQIKNISTH